MNKLKFIIGLSIVLVSSVLAYHFGFFLPKQKGQQDQVAQNYKCIDFGSKKYTEAYVKQDSGVAPISQTFTFNKDLDTCLYYEVSPKGQYIIDALKNTILYKYEEGCDPQQVNYCLSEANFAKKKAALIGKY